MANEYAASDAFKNRCTNAARRLQSCISYSIERISSDESRADRKENTLDVWLREGPQKPDVVVSLSGLYSVRPWEPALVPVFIDGISLIHLPESPAPWPAEAVARLERSDDLPELVWLRITGPLEVDAVASIVTVYQAQSDDAASVLPWQSEGVEQAQTAAENLGGTGQPGLYGLRCHS
ncbi:hypothetical protein Kpho02_58160 [Kitasatospora phosalacinea]|uniref:Uncharacterized protein n=1 Tax=Kitasatospora phosalacinea TaxID=2065 RepID=A0A9W6V5S2_9ACTN|nr:hypothetical protein [Kitasatospora phosalacinea]GLW73517.1 hypothetical protein Kpho02_58160 [Kitasatospora phosalacinea]